ncbi:MAG: GDP-mannose 4,6-dehydratase, partial [Acutalibacteraceae bacterium]
MKILVTGGAGFIGSNFIYYMLDKHPDYDIVCLDLLTYAGNLKTLDKAMANKHFKFVRGDIADRKFVNELFEKERFD